jgi:hypothetical protein
VAKDRPRKKRSRVGKTFTRLLLTRYGSGGQKQTPNIQHRMKSQTRRAEDRGQIRRTEDRGQQGAWSLREAQHSTLNTQRA